MSDKVKKVLKIIGLALAVVFILFNALVFYAKMKIDKGEWVMWEGKWYTQKQLDAKYPPQYYDTPAKNTPEEVYIAFREAILANDIEKALGLIRVEKRERYKEAFKDKEKLDEWVKTLPEKIENGKIDGNFAEFNWDKKDGYQHLIMFEKNIDGYWEIDGI